MLATSIRGPVLYLLMGAGAAMRRPRNFCLYVHALNFSAPHRLSAVSIQV